MNRSSVQAGPPHPPPADTRPARAVSGSERVRAEHETYLTDESRMPGGWADRLVFACNEKHVCDLLAEAGKRGTAVTVSGARTGIVGGAVPFGGTLLSLESFNGFLGAFRAGAEDEWRVRVEPGLTLEGLNRIIETGLLPEDGKTGGPPDRFPDTRLFLAESASWFYPPDPTEKTAHLGGTAATNASGSRSLKYGPTRQWLTALRIALSDGRVLELRRGDCMSNDPTVLCIRSDGSERLVHPPRIRAPRVKSTAGYWGGTPLDWIDLFIGSEGTLGVITEIELRLAPRPESVFGGLAFFRSEEEALAFVRNAMAKDGSDPSVLEFFDSAGIRLAAGHESGTGTVPAGSFPVDPGSSRCAVYFEQECPADRLEESLDRYGRMLSECGSSLDEAWGAVEEKELRRIADFRHALPEAINAVIGQRKRLHPGLHKVSTDFAVPAESFPNLFRLYRERLDPSGLEYVIFGHIGENHVHLNVLPRSENELSAAVLASRDLAAEAVRMGGTVSAEHGIGKLKKQLLALQFGPEFSAEGLFLISPNPLYL
jgi:D-lactate dehydrogenase (cytochrome)